MNAPVTAVVLCGGTSRRFGGTDKTRAELAGGTVLDHLLERLPPGWAVVCVGDARPTTREVTWARESPPGGGPVAGIAAGLARVATPTCAIVGGDMPFASPALGELAARLEAAPPEVDAAVATDVGGHAQPLLAAYRTAALRDALPGRTGGGRLMAVLDRLRLHLVACDERAVLDVDTPEALERARHSVEP